MTYVRKQCNHDKIVSHLKIQFPKQEIAYFDEAKNNIGALTSRLATGASAVKGVSVVFYQPRFIFQITFAAYFGNHLVCIHSPTPDTMVLLSKSN